MLARKVVGGQDLLSLDQQGHGCRKLLLEHLDYPGQRLLDRPAVRLLEDRPHRRRDHRLGTLRDAGQEVPQAVDPAPLPTHLSDHLLQPRVGVARPGARPRRIRSRLVRRGLGGQVVCSTRGSGDRGPGPAPRGTGRRPPGRGHAGTGGQTGQPPLQTGPASRGSCSSRSHQPPLAARIRSTPAPRAAHVRRLLWGRSQARYWTDPKSGPGTRPCRCMAHMLRMVGATRALVVARRTPLSFIEGADDREGIRP